MAAMAFTVSIEGADWLAGAAPEWNELVADAHCDPLFNGWAWQFAWWQHLDLGVDPAPAQLRILLLRDHTGRLIAILPLYEHATRLLGRLPIRRLQLLGSRLRGSGDNEFSEYCDGCARHGYEAIAAEHLAATLMDLPWDDLAAQCVPARGWIATHLIPALVERRITARNVDAMRAWGVDLRPGYAGWRDGLSSNTRRRAVAQRNRLADANVDSVERGGFAAFVADLNTLHQRRWDKPIYSERRQSFHTQLLTMLPEDALAASVLRDGDTRLSLLYNLRLQGREYNLQSAFDTESAQRVSPGYLHLGYAIERAAAAGMAYFDMLGGDGKTRAYKADLGAAGVDMWGYQLLRSPKLKVLYRAWDRWTAYRAE